MRGRAEPIHSPVLVNLMTSIDVHNSSVCCALLYTSPVSPDYATASSPKEPSVYECHAL